MTSKELIDRLVNTLGVSPIYLASLLGVSPNRMTSWEIDEAVEDSKKSRLNFLGEVVDHLVARGVRDLVSTLHNARVQSYAYQPDPDDPEDDGTVSLIGYITAFHDHPDWEVKVVEALAAYGI